MKNVFIFILLLFLFSCSDRSNYNIGDIERVGEKKVQYSAPKNNSETFKGRGVKEDKKIIKNGKIEYVVNNLSGIEENVSGKVKGFQGDVFSSNLSNNLLIINVKIPAEKFEDFLKESASFGKIINKYVSYTDTTKEFYDLKERVENKKIHLDKIRRYLKESKNIDEILKVESEINRVTDELESLEGNYSGLSDKTSYSLLLLEFRLPFKFRERSVISFMQNFKDLYYNIINFFIILIIFIVYFTVISTVLVFFSGVVYYIGFGKLGIIKKYFKKLSLEKKKK